MSDLKPCPFCGDSLRSILPGLAGQPRWMHPQSDDCPIGGYTLGGRDLVEQWNARKGESHE